MKQRIITGVLLTLFLVALIILPRVVMAVVAILAVSFSVWEEFHALAQAGHRPVSWPTWTGLVVGLLLNSLTGMNVNYTITILGAVCAVTAVCVLFREEPKLVDLSMSLLPVLTVLLPGLCLTVLSLEKQKAVQVVLMCMTFAIPLLGDTFALFGGRAIGGPKLCPAVSPNKTIAGAVAGLLGSVVASFLIMGISCIFCNEETLALLPAWYEYLYLGLLGGAIGQIGDLFASLVKRHSGIKDFSSLFPGHGGMLDRIDSVLFMAVLIYCFRLFE